jgi:choline dehydrogenase-like flavoprotein
MDKTAEAELPANILSFYSYPAAGCNVLVVGSGTSGLTVALELAALGTDDVVVTDQGPFAGFLHQSVASPCSLPESAGGWQSSGRNYSPPPGVVNSVGGRSRCWFGVVLPVEPPFLDTRWPRPVTDRLRGEGPGSYAATQGELAQWRGQSLTDPQSENDLRVIDRLAGLWPRMPFAVPPQAGRSSFTARRRGWSVYSPLLAWRGDGLSRHRHVTMPTIVHGLQALTLVTSGDRVTGVKFRCPDGTERVLCAERVVLAAGTLENTRLYGQVTAAPGGGAQAWAGLYDHVPHGFVAPLPPALEQAYQGADRTFIWVPLEGALGGNLFIDIHRSGFPEPVFDAWWLARQEEPHRDSVILDTNADGSASAQVRSALSGQDLAAMTERELLLGDLFESLSAGDAGTGPRMEQYPAIEKALATRKAVRYCNPLGTAEHEAGTIALGAHLRPGGQAPWPGNLFIAGPASFPPSGAANPTLTILALARQTADAVAAS